MPPSHYLNQCSLIGEFLWHSAESNFTASAQAAILYNEFDNYIFKLTATSPRSQLVKLGCDMLKQWELVSNTEELPKHTLKDMGN